MFEACKVVKSRWRVVAEREFRNMVLVLALKNFRDDPLIFQLIKLCGLFQDSEENNECLLSLC